LAPPSRSGILASLPTAFSTRSSARFAGPEPSVSTEGSDAESRRKSGEGQIDAASTSSREGEDARPIIDEGYRMMSPASHRSAGRATLDPAESASETMIARRSCESLAETSRFFTQRGVRPRFSSRSANDDRCMAMVRAGMGVTTAPESLRCEGVVAVPSDGYDFRRRIGSIDGKTQRDDARSASRSACDSAIA
ncbi:hypothetical protein OY671_008333, partial [Metschnikowia pulcherrima]